MSETGGVFCFSASARILRRERDALYDVEGRNPTSSAGGLIVNLGSLGDVSRVERRSTIEAEGIRVEVGGVCGMSSFS